MNNIFSLSRTVKLIRKDLLSEYKSLLTWLSSAAGVMVVISALNILFEKFKGAPTSGAPEFHMIFYILLLFPGGYIMTSTMFKDVHDKSRNIYWLTMPGSTFEKFLSRLLISSIFYVVLLTLLYPLLAAVSELFNLTVFGMRHDFFNPFTSDVAKLIPYYLVTQSLFFAGAASFRKHPIAKTILTIAVFQIVLSLIAVLLLRIFFGSSFNFVSSLDFNGNFMNFTDFHIDSLIGFGKIMTSIGKVLFWGIMAPFFYILTYLKLSEKEVCDGF